MVNIVYGHLPVHHQTMYYIQMENSLQNKGGGGHCVTMEMNVKRLELTLSRISAIEVLVRDLFIRTSKVIKSFTIV
jgi:hypothetical protein